MEDVFSAGYLWVRIVSWKSKRWYRFAKKAQKDGVRYIIMNRNKPLFELKPFKEDQDLENIFADIIVAKEDIKKGRVYSQDDILAEFV